jgi:hypothetical protein
MGLFNKVIAHVTEAPTVEISDGIALVRYRIGGVRLRRTLSVKTLEKAVERGQRALARYSAGEQNVIVDD